MIRAFCLCVFVQMMHFSCSQVKQISLNEDLPNAIPVLRITNDTSASPIRISALAIDINIAANIAITTFDITFYNPNNRILEGELEFPLADGQHVIRYALDIDGKLREGVVVEKAKARVAFENTIRQKIDPGLVEKTKGNNFRTRIYPLPANGTRHIVIAIEQTLELSGKDLVYQLPLKASEAIEKFSIRALVLKTTVKPRSEETNFNGFTFSKKESNWSAEFAESNYIPNTILKIVIPGADDETDIVLVENHEETSYFYVSSPKPIGHKKKELPKTVGLLWDISASAIKRDLEKEKQFIKQWLAQFSDLKVSLIPFNISVQNIQHFDISGGNSDALVKAIENLIYDGGTQLGIIDCNTYQFDEIVIFSDGLSTFGKKDMILSAAPVSAISSSSSSDFSYLKFITWQTHGKFIDLTKIALKDAVDELSNQSLEVIKVEFSDAGVEDLVLQNEPTQNSRLSFAGKLKTSATTITLHLGFGNEITKTKTFTIKKPDKSDYENVKRIWAEMKIANLDLQFDKNKEEITKLGKQFSIVTQNTSLIVLDRVEDYVEHEITPPEELQKEYYRLLNEKKENEKNNKTTGLDDALETMGHLKEWWQKNFSPGKKVKDTMIPDSNYITSAPLSYTDANALADDDVQAQSPRRDSVLSYHLSINSGVVAFRGEEQLGSTAFRMDNVGRVAMRFDREENKEPVAETPTTVIEVNEWRSDASYLKEIEKVAATDRKTKYYALRTKYFNQPSFFIDIARFFNEKNEKEFALLVLSNVAEMKLEDAELLRMMANELLEVNEKGLAIETFRELVKMREEQPHSYRDLALALHESGNHNEAVELLYKVITGSWDERFQDIRSIAINEMNAIISAHRASVNIASIDKRLIYAMPVDIRIVIAWNTDNSDIDLWVTDPRKEKCYYQHTETEIGGKISEDITDGYGPEEFCLKKAWKGTYTIEANLYGDSRQTLGGPITIKAELFTDFGRPTQKREIVNFRVTTNKDVVKIGSLKFDH